MELEVAARVESAELKARTRAGPEAELMDLESWTGLGSVQGLLKPLERLKNRL